MRIGLIADIHEAAALAEAAIRELRRLDVDEIICLGDFCEMGLHLAETCELLLRENVRCVWGNHDYGLCCDARAEIEIAFPKCVSDFARSAQATLQIDQYRFMHIEPWLNPNELEDLWHFDGFPDTAEKRARIFAVPGWKIAFAGHFHCWLAVSETEHRSWDGATEIDLSLGRHFVVIDACLHGAFAMFDTSTGILTPLRVTQ